MGQCQSPADHTAYRLASSIGDVVHRQDNDVISDATAAIITSKTLNLEVFHHLPPFSFQIVNVDMRALPYSGNHLSDIFAILDHGIAGFEIFERNFVSERNSLQGGELNSCFAIEGCTVNDLPLHNVHHRNPH